MLTGIALACSANTSFNHGSGSAGSTGSSQGDEHVYHTTVTDVWSCPAKLQGYLVEAIVR